MFKIGSLPDNSTGFSLLELMTVVAIIGLLAMLGVPAYKDYANRARRADATNSLLALQAEQEKFRSTCVSYATQLTGTRTCTSGSPPYILGRSPDSADGHYTLAIVNASASSYLMTATPKNPGAQASDSCGTFAITQDGPDHTGTYASAKCWGR